MKGFVLALSALTLTAIALLTLTGKDSDSQYNEQFLSFKRKFKKSYGTQSEVKFRLSIFAENMRLIKKSNADESKRFTLGVTPFADMTFEEFVNQYLMKPRENPYNSVLMTESLLRGKVDWRNTRGAVGKVKDQGQCGSCWAFSTVASTETSRFLAGNSFVSLSEQELVDCASSYGNSGCQGGIMPNAFNYIMENGITTEKEYPYTGYGGNCRAAHTSPRYSIDSYAQINPINVNGLMAATDQTVVAVAIEVQNDLMLYTGGVYHASRNCGYSLNHAVNTVGYDSETDDPYFIVRNSWGSSWGEKGYFRMAIGTNNGTCGIANETCTYPTF